MWQYFNNCTFFFQRRQYDWTRKTFQRIFNEVWFCSKLQSYAWMLDILFSVWFVAPSWPLINTNPRCTTDRMRYNDDAMWHCLILLHVQCSKWIPVHHIMCLLGQLNTSAVITSNMSQFLHDACYKLGVFFKWLWHKKKSRCLYLMCVWCMNSSGALWCETRAVTCQTAAPTACRWRFSPPWRSSGWAPRCGSLLRSRPRSSRTVWATPRASGTCTGTAPGGPARRRRPAAGRRRAPPAPGSRRTARRSRGTSRWCTSPPKPRERRRRSPAWGRWRGRGARRSRCPPWSRRRGGCAPGGTRSPPRRPSTPHTAGRATAPAAPWSSWLRSPEAPCRRKVHEPTRRGASRRAKDFIWSKVDGAKKRADTWSECLHQDWRAASQDRMLCGSRENKTTFKCVKIRWDEIIIY